MGALPDRAGVVVIGAGIVGNSLAWHPARLGWRDIVLIDKGTLPNPGGSTGHASNFIFLTDHSKEMTALTLDSVEQYAGDKVSLTDAWVVVGGGRGIGSAVSAARKASRCSRISPRCWAAQSACRGS